MIYFQIYKNCTICFDICFYKRIFILHASICYIRQYFFKWITTKNSCSFKAADINVFPKPYQFQSDWGGAALEMEHRLPENKFFYLMFEEKKNICVIYINLVWHKATSGGYIIKFEFIFVVTVDEMSLLNRDLWEDTKCTMDFEIYEIALFSLRFMQQFKFLLPVNNACIKCMLIYRHKVFLHTFAI